MLLILKTSKRNWIDLCTVYSARWIAFITAKEPQLPPKVKLVEMM